MAPRTQAERAAKIWISTPALSLYVNAHRVPSIAVLRSMYELATKSGRAHLICTWEELVELRALAKLSTQKNRTQKKPSAREASARKASSRQKVRP